MKIKLFSLLILLFMTGSLWSQPNRSFSVKVTGTGSVNVVLIPGFSCSGEVWESLVTRYSANYTFHTLTFAGFAGEAPQNNPSLNVWIDDVAAYIIAHKLSHPVVVGHSMGGGIALDLAARFPLLISKIIVVDALPCLSAIYNPSFTAVEKPNCSEIVKQFTSLDQNQFYSFQKKGIKSLMADTTYQEKVVEWSVKSDRTTLGQIYCQFLNFDLRNTLSSIKCPTLILLEAPFKSNASVMEGQFKSLEEKYKTIHYAPSALHFIMYDNTEWFLNEVSSFLK